MSVVNPNESRSVPVADHSIADEIPGAVHDVSIPATGTRTHRGSALLAKNSRSGGPRSPLFVHQVPGAAAVAHGSPHRAGLDAAVEAVGSGYLNEVAATDPGATIANAPLGPSLNGDTGLVTPGLGLTSGPEAAR